MKATRLFSLIFTIGSGLVLTAAVAAGCGSSDDDGFRNEGDGGLDTYNPNPFSDARFGDSGPCQGLECKRAQCNGGQTPTTLKGTVYDPAGKNPLYNALVYIANGTVEPFDWNEDVKCDQCAKASGSPINAVQTGPDGKFEMVDVPAGVDLPLVVQIGKWRRQLTIPAVTACEVKDLAAEKGADNKPLIRLPSKQSEGDIPRIAIATGGADSFECLLKKIGIDDEEFTVPSGAGRIHYYHAYLGHGLRQNNPPVPEAATLWSDPAKLRKRDVVLLPCESSPSNKKDNGDTLKGPNEQTLAGYQNVEKYLGGGGRVFVTHYSYTWLNFNHPSLSFRQVADWDQQETDRDDRTGAVDKILAQLDTTLPNGAVFPKGVAFADWLRNFGGSPDPDGRGTLRIDEWRHDVKTVNPAFAQRWVRANTKDNGYNPASNAPPVAGEVVQHFTFNTPINPPRDPNGAPLHCGKVVHSDFHVTAAGKNEEKNFPAECVPGDMTPQEKALEFMFFDLSSCVQDETKPPIIVR